MIDFFLASAGILGTAGILIWILTPRKVKMFQPLGDTTCEGPHDWEDVFFASSADIPDEIMAKGANAARAYLSKNDQTKRKVCMNSGFVSGTDKKVSQTYLVKMVAELSIAKAAEKQQEEQRVTVDELEKAFFEEEVSWREGTDRDHVLEGYDLHRTFVDQLPDLLEQRELAEVLRDLRSQEDSKKS